MNLEYCLIPVFEGYLNHRVCKGDHSTEIIWPYDRKWGPFIGELRSWGTNADEEGVDGWSKMR
jgi:hypothetical protein